MEMTEDVVSFFPISLGTGLALQAACGIDEKGAGSGPAPLLGYDVLLVNVRTVYRNFYSGLPIAERDSLTPKASVDGLNAELRVLIEAVKDYTDGACTVVLYCNGYKSLDKLYPYAKIKPLNTELQQRYAEFENRTIEELSNKSDQYGLEFALGDVSLPPLPDGTKVLIATHFPVDLLNPGRWSMFDLLESHTGKIKGRFEWTSKLGVDKENVERIPFNRATWQLFGDKGNMISPQPAKLRKALIELAKKDRWTAQTTKSRMMFSLKQNRDPVLQGEVSRLFL